MKKLCKSKTQRQYGLNPVYEEQIASLSSDIMHSRGGNIFLNQDKVITIDIMPLIQYILMKKLKSKEDRDVLIEYLKSLENFMSLLNLDTSELFNEMLIRLSKSLLLQETVHDTILFRTGEKGSLFYIIIKGSVSVLIPKTIKAQMTPEEYLTHLCFLNQLGENELQILTAESNKEIYDIDLSYPTNPKIINMSNKSLDSYAPRGITYFSVNEFISCLIPNTTKEDNYYYPYVSVWIYHKVRELTKGNTFGETALLSKSALRTATIYLNEDTIFGILNELEFNMTLKNLQIQYKKDCIMFVLSFNLFNELNYEVFSRKYWNNFTHIRLKQGESLFQQYDKRDLVYLCKEGEFELSSRLSIGDIDKLLRRFGDMKQINQKKREIKSKRKRIRIACIKNKIIIGLEDLIDEKNCFICSVVCKSKKAEVFGVNTQVFNEIIDYAGTNNQYKTMIKEKIDVIVSRLKTYQQVENFILKNETYSIIKSKLLPVFVNHQMKKVQQQRKSVLYMNNTDILTQKNKQTLNKKGLFTTLIADNKIKNSLITPKISFANSYNLPKHFGINNHLRPSIYQRSSICQTKKSSLVKEPQKTTKTNKTLCDTMIFTKTNKNQTNDRQSIQKTFNKDIVNKSTDMAFERHFNKLKKKIDSNSFNKQLIYSNLTLNPNYTLSTKCCISNIMDYCIMEHEEKKWIKVSPMHKHIKINTKLKKQTAIRLLYGSKNELNDFIERTE